MSLTRTTADLVLTCGDCRSDFTFTVAEQEFFASKNFEPPKRCPGCRRLRRAEKAGAASVY